MGININMYRENDIVSFKLVTGEEMVARVVSDTDTEITVYKPLTLVHSGQGFALMQTLMSSRPDTNIVVRKSSVVMSAMSRDEMSTAWYESTSGIKTAKSSILMG